MRARVLILLLAPSVALARLPVLIDFTEEHQVDEVQLSGPDRSAIASQLAGGGTYADSKACRGKQDRTPVVVVDRRAARGDVLGDGAPQLVVLASVQSCDPDGVDSRQATPGIVALVRDGKVLASARGLSGNARIEALVRPQGAARDLVILAFGWMHMGVTGDGAEIWGSGAKGLVRLRRLGPVFFERCGLSDEEQSGAAVFFVRSVEPLELLEKTYQRPCSVDEDLRWKFAGDGELAP